MNQSTEKISRPVFPKRAVVTAGMPYGNKELHFGHIGGVFIQADTFVRFLKDRIGSENVIFVSGTDCYGSPIVENHRRLNESGKFTGTISEFVKENHEKQKKALEAYQVCPSLFAASGLDEAVAVHEEFCQEFFMSLYKGGHLEKLTTSQFYDEELQVYLNGRQVVGQCPIQDCSSEKGYADECSLGHQYSPEELINPVSKLSGKAPAMRNVTNWYFKLEDFYEQLLKWVGELKEKDNTRSFMIKYIEEFLKPPVIYIKRNQQNLFNEISDSLPKYELEYDEKKPSFVIKLRNLQDREKCCHILSEKGIRYRTGKTLVPFRLTGNIDWGVPACDVEDVLGLTFWVWPESLWAPISFTKTYLQQTVQNREEWTKWWKDNDAKVYQFIGEDNIYFYGPAEMAMFIAADEKMPLPELVVNSHVLFLDKKAGSSSEVKPPMALELLNHYTSEQLRAHFLGLGLGMRSVSFQPKPYNPSANEKDADPVVKEGNLLANVFNRIVRSCFYTSQTYFNNKIPTGEISTEILESANETIIQYEWYMYKFEFHNVMSLLDTYIRNANKYWVKNMKEAEAAQDEEKRRQTLIDGFHIVRTAGILLHPIAPSGTSLVLEYLQVDERFWQWNYIFEPIYKFIENIQAHTIKPLPPRFDFFSKHESQF